MDTRAVGWREAWKTSPDDATRLAMDELAKQKRLAEQRQYLVGIHIKDTFPEGDLV